MDHNVVAKSQEQVTTVHTEITFNRFWCRTNDKFGDIQIRLEKDGSIFIGARNIRDNDQIEIPFEEFSERFIKEFFPHFSLKKPIQ